MRSRCPTLVKQSSDVLVVAARVAWPEYKCKKYHAYVCQPRRTFRDVDRIAFYSHGRIQTHVPMILEIYESVLFERDKHDGWRGDLVNRLLEDGPREEGKSYKMIRLSPPDDAQTIKLEAPIVHDGTGAFTQGHRYVVMERLEKAKRTSDLVRI